MIYLNGKAVNTTMFPDNTSQVWKLGEQPGIVTVTWKFSHEGEFMQLAQLKDLLNSMGVKADLVLPYLPYGRQDRWIGDNVTFALHTFAKMLNFLRFETVTIVDPHSPVAYAVIDNVIEEYPSAKDHMNECGSTVVCFPDLGAQEKYADLYSRRVQICAYKKRSQSSGAITEHNLIGDCVGQRVMIVDDICDGGATFVSLAKLLFDRGATQVDLFVTHGLFTKGLRPLRDAGIGRIFTKDGEVSEPLRVQ